MTQLAAAMQALPQAIGDCFRQSCFADSGPFARDKFPKSMEFFAATKDYQNVNIFGSNRSSKSFTVAYAAAAWATGDYTDWWPGRVFHKPVRGWIAGETGVLVRNNIQRYLIGEKGSEGQGCFIPGNKIRHISYQSKPEGLAEKVIIDSSFGGGSVIEFKSYDQGQYRFASDSIDFGAYDEEPSHGIYSELTTRTSTNHGIVCGGFTGLRNITPLIEHLAPEFAGGEHKRPEDTGIINIVIGWDDIPDSLLSQSERKRLRATYGANEVLARTTGIPCVGLGQVYLIPEADFVLPYFEVPEHWPRFFAIDPGFTAPTAIAYFAYDSDNDAIYQIGEHYVKGMPVAVHADAIHRHGDWMPGIIDYAGGNITDGKGVLQEYRKACRNPLINANKSISMGHMAVMDRLQTGRWFIFDTLRHTRQEFRQYHRNEKGAIAATPRHLMDCWRYGALGVQHAKQRPFGYRFNGDSMKTYNPAAPKEMHSLTEGIFQ
jgi:phage terminase large subunit-like protein